MSNTANNSSSSTRKLLDHTRDFFLCFSFVVPLYVSMWAAAELTGIGELFTIANILIIFASALVYFATYEPSMRKHLKDYIEEIPRIRDWCEENPERKRNLLLALNFLSVLGIGYLAYTLGPSGATGFGVIIKLLSPSDDAVLYMLIASLAAIAGWGAYLGYRAYQAIKAGNGAVLGVRLMHNLGKLFLPILIILDYFIMLANSLAGTNISYLAFGQSFEDSPSSSPSANSTAELSVSTHSGTPPRNNGAAAEDKPIAFIIGQTMSWASAVLLGFVVFSLSFFLAGAGIEASVVAAAFVFLISAISIRHSVDDLIHKLFDSESVLRQHLSGKEGWRSYLIFGICMLASLAFNITFLDARPFISDLCTSLPTAAAASMLAVGVVAFLLLCIGVSLGYQHRGRGPYGFGMMLSITLAMLGLGGLAPYNEVFWAISVLGAVIITLVNGFFFSNFYFSHELEVETAEFQRSVTDESAATSESTCSAVLMGNTSLEKTGPINMVSIIAFAGTFFFFMAAVAYSVAPHTLAKVSGNEGSMTKVSDGDNPYVYLSIGLLSIFISVVFFATLRNGLNVLRSDSERMMLNHAHPDRLSPTPAQMATTSGGGVVFPSDGGGNNGNVEMTAAGVGVQQTL